MRATEQLLDWYQRNRRDLPWRRTRDAWAIWVSETMLQQTRVETAVPYFERFLERFPVPRALAEADEQEALALWSGLGYYARVRRLRAAAQSVEKGGGIPRTAAELARLPGVGPYTAAAIASIAHGEPVPVLDGNVARVLSRRLALTAEPARATTRRRLLTAAAELLDPERPGDSNQALMELGATICTPRAPDCRRCPLSSGCGARKRGLTEVIPLRRTRPRPERVSWCAALVERSGGELLLVRRGEHEELMPGLWEPPTVAGERPDPADFGARFGGTWRFDAEPLTKIRHTVTFRRIELRAYRAFWRSRGDVAEGVVARWATRVGAGRLPLTGAARKLLAFWRAGA